LFVGYSVCATNVLNDKSTLTPKIIFFMIFFKFSSSVNLIIDFD